MCIRDSGTGALTFVNASTLKAAVVDSVLPNNIVISNGVAATFDAGTNYVVDAGVTNDHSNNLALIGSISGAGSLVKTNIGNLTLSGTLSYSNGTTVADGNLIVVKTNLTATINSNTVNIAMSNNVATGTYQVLPGLLNGTYSAAAYSGGPSGTTATFDTVTGLVAVTVPTTATPYSSWLTNYPSLTGANTNGTADPDGDGFNNNLEFAFNGNPTTGTPSLLTVTNVGGIANFTFIATTNGVSYQAQSTTNLATSPWTNSPISVANAADQTGITPALAGYVRKSFVTNASGKIFYRVVATITNQ